MNKNFRTIKKMINKGNIVVFKVDYTYKDKTKSKLFYGDPKEILKNIVNVL